MANAINREGGKDAVNLRDPVNLRIAEQYVSEFGNLAKESTTMILP